MRERGRDGAGRPPKARFFRSPLRWFYEFLVEEVDDGPSAGRPVTRGRGGRRPAPERGLPGIVYAGAGLCLAAVVFLVATHLPPAAGHPRATTRPSPATAAPKPRPKASGAARQPSESASATSAPPTPAAGSPNCAAMQMTAVPPAAGSTRPAVAGLCESVGNGENWAVGCATGFQASCAPALQPELACLRQARHAIDTADVQACAAQVEQRLAGTSG